MRTLCRSILSLAILLVLNFISLGTPAIAQQYIITDLGTLGGTQGYATAVNGSGQVVGDCNPTGLGAPHAFWWTQEGGMVDIGTLGGAFSYAKAVNDSGQVVGFSYIGMGLERHAFLWTDASGMVDLGTLGGTFGSADAVNESCQVVGTSTTTTQTDPAGNEPRHAFLWTDASGMVDLGTLGGTHSWGDAVNGSGQVVGHSYLSGDSVYHAFLWTEEGGMVDLGTLGEAYSSAHAVNASGQVVSVQASPAVVPGVPFRGHRKVGWSTSVPSAVPAGAARAIW